MPPQNGRDERDGLSTENERKDGTAERDVYDRHLALDQLDPYQPIERRSVYRHESFITYFATSKGPPQIVVLCLLLAMGFGCTIGVVPAVVTDRYARLNHGYTDESDCADYDVSTKPLACLEGSNDAQNAAAIANLISNTLTFISSSLVGSISDEKGRKGIILIGLLISASHPLILVLLQLKEDMSPTWYYGSNAIGGIINWIAVALSALSDVMPPKWRAPSFGLLLAGFSLGFAFAPMLALVLNHFWVSVLSLALVLSGLVVTMLFFQETLPPQVAAEVALRREEERPSGETKAQAIARIIMRPMTELSILNRSHLFRLLSALAFFSGMVTSADQTLLLYYVEDRLGFNDQDVALMFFLIGVLGILVQGALIKPINDWIGERLVIAVAFSFGSVHNFLYGIATSKSTIYVAVCISSFTGMSFPTISAIKSNNVDESEQGRIQGALYSLQALASALGPMTLRYVYHLTKDGELPGAMFIFASFLYLIAVACACALPKDQANSRKPEECRRMVDDDGSEPDSYGTALL